MCVSYEVKYVFREWKLHSFLGFIIQQKDQPMRGMTVLIRWPYIVYYGVQMSQSASRNTTGIPQIHWRYFSCKQSQFLNYDIIKFTAKFFN